nr:13839_t:CDS:2 [Entrophospora candida]
MGEEYAKILAAGMEKLVDDVTNEQGSTILPAQQDLLKPTDHYGPRQALSLHKLLRVEPNKVVTHEFEEIEEKVECTRLGFFKLRALT